MHTLPANAVLLLIDLQKAIDQPVWAAAGPRNNPGAEAAARRLLDRWRASGRAVIHVRHDSVEPGSTYRPGQAGHAFKEITAPLAGETVIAKRTASAFVGTDLDARLRAIGGPVLICGVITNNAIEATARMAGDLGHRACVVADACFTFARLDWSGRLRSAAEVHDMTLANLHGEYCTVLDSAQVLAAADAISTPSPAPVEKLSAVLWAGSAGQAASILAHPFVRGLADGTLPVERFKTYVAQDAYFLEAFARAYASCLTATRDRDGLYAFAGLIAGVIDELRLHAGYAARWQVDLDGVVPGAATRAYTDFLAETARGGDIGATAAAMTPCMRLYAWLGRQLAADTVAPAYAEWVRTYADPAFEALAVTLEDLLDRHAVDSPLVRRNYARAMELEYGFFDAHR
jgi:thiaminase/transcriptional activator TenA